MSSRDGIFGKVIRGKTTPGSVAAQTQYKQMWLMLRAKWLFVLIIVVIAVAYSLLWIALAMVALSFIGIPAERRFLGYLRDNAYPDGSRRG